jgi:hypothetical protein
MNPNKNLIEPKPVFSGIHVRIRLYQVFSGIHVRFRFYQVFIGIHVNLSSIIEPKPYMNPTKNLIELKFT